MGQSPVKSPSFVLWKSPSEHGRATLRLLCKMSVPQDSLATIVLARKRLPNILAVIVRFTEVGTNAFMMRFSRPGMILEWFTRNAFRPSDTHCSTLIGFIGMIRGSNPRLPAPAALRSTFDRNTPN